MSGKNDAPKMEFRTNIAETIELIRCFWEGTNTFGKKSFGWSIKHDGVEKVYFASEHFQKLLDGMKPGEKVVVCKKEEKGEGGKVYTKWDVHPAIFEPNGAPAQQPKDIAKDPEARDEWRESRMRQMKEALYDASKVVQSYNDYVLAEHGDNGGPPPLGGEDLRAIAISFMIEEQRKTR